MAKYLLDTNICIGLFKHSEPIYKQVLKIGLKNIYISEITIAELYFGAHKSKNRKHFEEVNQLKQHFEVLPISNTLEIYAKLRADLETKGSRIDNFDLLIGATALRNNLIIVTENKKHFDRINGLQIENWSNNN